MEVFNWIFYILFINYLQKLERDLNNSILELENSRETSNTEAVLEEKVSELKSDLKFALEEKKSIEKKLRQAKEKDG